MSKKEIMDKLLDDLIKEASILASEDKGCEYEEPNENEPPFSKEHEAKMEALFAAERRKLKRKSRKMTVKHTLIAAVILIAAMTITIFSVSALRIRFLNFIIEMTQTNSKIEFKEDAEGDSFSSDEISLNYIPEGFSFENKNIRDDRIIIKFKKDEDYFNFSMRKIETDNRIDTENANIIERIKINGYDGLYSSNDNINVITWHDEIYVYKIYGSIAQKELVKIGENVEKHNN